MKHIRRLAAGAALVICALSVNAGQAQGLPNPALGALAQEIAPARDEVESAAAVIPSPAVLERDLAAIRAWRQRLNALAPPASRTLAPVDAHDARFLRAQLTYMTRLITMYKANPTARDGAQRLSHAGYADLLRDDLLLPYTASDIERLARAQLTESLAKIAWLETLAPLAHTVIAQELNIAPAIDVLTFVGTHNLLTIPAGLAVDAGGDPGTVLAAVQRAIAQHNSDLVRASSTCTVFEQGWAAYAAQMLVAVGFYGDDPTSRMRLALAQRADAAGAMIDLKVATSDWTRGQAVQFLVRETGAGAQQAQALVAGIALHPGVAIAPLVGRLQLENLLAQYRTRMNARGSLRDFHDRLLSYGSVPFAILGPELLSDLPKP